MYLERFLWLFYTSSVRLHPLTAIARCSVPHLYFCVVCVFCFAVFFFVNSHHAVDHLKTVVLVALAIHTPPGGKNTLTLYGHSVNETNVLCFGKQLSSK